MFTGHRLLVVAESRALRQTGVRSARLSLEDERSSWTDRTVQSLGAGIGLLGDLQYDNSAL